MLDGPASNLIEQLLIACSRLGYSGDSFHLPSERFLTRAERNAMIRAEFNGRNLAAICKKYGVSRRTVYYACRRHS